MEYNNILDRIVDIINLSNQKKRELESQGLLSEKEQFYSFYPYLIYKDYYNEFNTLREKELTYYLLRTDKYAALKNQSLVRECYKLIESDIANKEDYEKIINIINRCNGKGASDLLYLNGYFVCIEDLEMLKYLCKKYSIGMYKKVLNNEIETLEQFENSKKQINEQKRRFHKYIEDKNINNQKSNNVDLSVDSNDFKKLNIHINSKFNELIYLGMLGSLKPKMIIDLKLVMDSNSFSELLNEFKKYEIFNQEELLDISLEANKNINYPVNINELVSFLSTRKNLNIEALKLLIPSIGIENYQYLIEQLNKLNVSNNDVSQSR